MHSRCSINVLTVVNFILLNNQWGGEAVEFRRDWPAECVLLVTDMGMRVLASHRFFKAQRALQETQARGLVEGQLQGPSLGSAFSAGTQMSQPTALGRTLCSVKSELSPAYKRLQTEGFW